MGLLHVFNFNYIDFAQKIIGIHWYTFGYKIVPNTNLSYKSDLSPAGQLIEYTIYKVLVSTAVKNNFMFVVV
jgi:hypothetical protein